ncbi:MAG: hypothetical protein K8S18_13960 [Desulfobacula sp.]|nr:hypothetical protein [Desulfobacula sp.]
MHKFLFIYLLFIGFFSGFQLQAAEHPIKLHSVKFVHTDIYSNIPGEEYFIEYCMVNTAPQSQHFVLANHVGAAKSTKIPVDGNGFISFTKQGKNTQSMIFDLNSPYNVKSFEKINSMVINDSQGYKMLRFMTDYQGTGTLKKHYVTINWNNLNPVCKGTSYSKKMSFGAPDNYSIIYRGVELRLSKKRPGWMRLNLELQNKTTLPVKAKFEFHTRGPNGEWISMKKMESILKERSSGFDGRKRISLRVRKIDKTYQYRIKIQSKGQSFGTEYHSITTCVPNT